MREKDIKKLLLPEGQDRNVFNGFKRILATIDQLTNEQLALLNFECFHEARVRSGAVE